MTEKKKTVLAVQLLGWIGLIITVLKHYKKLKPDLETFFDATRTAARVVAVRAAVIYTEYIVTIGRPVYIGPSDKKKWVVLNYKDRVKFTTTQLYKRSYFKFLFKGESYEDLKKIVEGYIIPEEV